MTLGRREPRRVNLPTWKSGQFSFFLSASLTLASMTTWSYTVVDAFTSAPFSGNPAAVIVLPPSSIPADSAYKSAGPDVQGWPTDELSLQVASEFNLSETAYLLPLAEWTAEAPVYGLRWFTPAVEAPLVSQVSNLQ